MAGGSVLSGVSSYQSGQGQKAMAEYNARIQEMQAERERQAAIQRSREVARQGREVMGAQRARYAAGGVGGRTPMSMALQTARDVKMDQLRTISEGMNRSSYLMSQAEMSTMQGKQASQAGTMGLFSGLMSGAGGAMYGMSQLKESGLSSSQNKPSLGSLRNYATKTWLEQ